jgi:hypothetical protein
VLWNVAAEDAVSFTVQDFVREADEQLRRYDQHAARFLGLAEDTERRRSELAARLDVAAMQIADALLPDLSQNSFQALSDKLGMPELTGILRRSRERETKIDARVAAIEETEAYNTRDSVRGRAELQLDEVRPLFDHALKDLRYLDSLPRIQQLMTRGYGTPDYPHKGIFRYFKREFLEDWKRADEACAALKVSSFSEVAARYRDRTEQCEVLGRTVHDIEEKLKNIADLEGERDRLLAERAAQPDTMRLEAGKRIASLLKSNTKLIELLGFPETLQGRIREIDGMEHQVEYLRSLRLQIEQDAAQVQERAAKLRDERDRYNANMYRYRNKQFTSDQFEKRFRRDGRYDKLYTRYERTGNTVYVFNDYNRTSGLDDFLWWDVMTDGRLDGNFIPEVQEYVTANPNYQYDRSVFASSGDSRDFGAAGDFGDDS